MMKRRGPQTSTDELVRRIRQVESEKKRELRESQKEMRHHRTVIQELEKIKQQLVGIRERNQLMNETLQRVQETNRQKQGEIDELGYHLRNYQKIHSDLSEKLNRAKMLHDQVRDKYLEDTQSLNERMAANIARYNPGNLKKEISRLEMEMKTIQAETLRMQQQRVVNSLGADGGTRPPPTDTEVRQLEEENDSLCRIVSEIRAKLQRKRKGLSDDDVVMLDDTRGDEESERRRKGSEEAELQARIRIGQLEQQIEQLQAELQGKRERVKNMAEDLSKMNEQAMRNLNMLGGKMCIICRGDVEDPLRDLNPALSEESKAVLREAALTVVDGEAPAPASGEGRMDVEES